MIITELIEKLQEDLKLYGDIPVFVRDHDGLFGDSRYTMYDDDLEKELIV